MKDLITVKQGKATTVQDRYSSEQYDHKANGDPSVLNCPHTDTEDDYPVLLQSLKKEKSAGVDNIPAELVQAGGEDVITALTTVCNRIWQTGEWPTPWTQSLVCLLYTSPSPRDILVSRMPSSA